MRNNPAVPEVEVKSSSVEPIVVDIPTAARLLSTTKWAIRQLIWSKQIHPIKIGKKLVIDPADLRAYVQKRKARAA